MSSKCQKTLILESQEAHLSPFEAPAATGASREPKIDKQLKKKRASGGFLEETSQKARVREEFVATAILENDAPVQAGARFAKKHTCPNSVKKTDLLATLFGAIWLPKSFRSRFWGDSESG